MIDDVFLLPDNKKYDSECVKIARISSQEPKVLKCCGWGERAVFMPVAFRIAFDQGSGDSYGGIRCVMDP